MNSAWHSHLLTCCAALCCAVNNWYSYLSSATSPAASDAVNATAGQRDAWVCQNDVPVSAVQ